jgi:transcriptional regulator NrdR family protein
VANLRPTDKFLCPHCGESQSRVKSVRFNYQEEAVMRIRACPCGVRYLTTERVVRLIHKKSATTLDKTQYIADASN